MRALLARSHTVICSDIVGSSAGDRRRQVHLDNAHEAVLDRAIAEVRDPRYPIAEAFRRTDGDSATLVVGATVARAWLVADFVLRELAVALAEVNTGVDEHHRLRLRVALAHGELVVDPPHLGGAPVVQAARLRDAPALRTAMNEHPEAALGVIVSDALHRDVVLPGERGLDTVPFRPVQVAVKDFAEPAWLHLPATATAPPPSPEPPPSAPPPSSDRSTGAPAATEVPAAGQVADVVNTFHGPTYASHAVFGIARPCDHS